MVGRPQVALALLAGSLTCVRGGVFTGALAKKTNEEPPLRLVDRNQDYSKAGTVCAYADPAWVSRGLYLAGLHAESAQEVAQMVPESAGIPGGTANSKGSSALDSFQCDLNPTDVLFLKNRAATLEPPIPWLVLALYHRGMLQWARPHYALERFQNELSVVATDERVTLLQRLGVRTSSRIIDAGCGWGRLGRRLAALLNTGSYFGLDIDAFELRAFIQFEIGLENPALMQKKPSIIRSAEFEFNRLLRDSGQVDFVIFSSVLKITMPRSLRELALRNAAHVIRPAGRVVIFPAGGSVVACNDPGYDFDAIAREIGAFAPIRSVFLSRSSHVNQHSHPNPNPAAIRAGDPVYACVLDRLFCRLPVQGASSIHQHFSDLQRPFCKPAPGQGPDPHFRRPAGSQAQGSPPEHPITNTTKRPALPSSSAAAAAAQQQRKKSKQPALVQVDADAKKNDHDGPAPWRKKGPAPLRKQNDDDDDKASRKKKTGKSPLKQVSSYFDRKAILEKERRGGKRG